MRLHPWSRLLCIPGPGGKAMWSGGRVVVRQAPPSRSLCEPPPTNHGDGDGPVQNRA
jgi:hypothetical protein